MGDHLFEKCLCGALANRTRIMATHQVRVLNRPEIDHIIVLDAGRVIDQGTYAQLVQRGSLQALQHAVTMELGSPSGGTPTATPVAASSNADIPKSVAAAALDETTEQSARGSLRWSVMTQYLRAYGTWPALMLIALLFILTQVLLTRGCCNYLLGAMKRLVFAYCDKSVREKDWCYRMHGTQVT
jgi:hypothetical protein